MVPFKLIALLPEPAVIVAEVPSNLIALVPTPAVITPVVPSSTSCLAAVPTVTLLLAFTESTVISLFNLVVIFLPARSTVILEESPLKSTLLLFATLSPASPLADTVHVYAFLEMASLIDCATFFASAIPLLADATPLALTLISCVLPAMVIPFVFAVVVM